MADEKRIFAKKLNYYMEKNGKTQTDLIVDLGINKSTISTWCSGVKMPRMGTIQTLADYFGVMKSDLIEEKAPTGRPGELWEYLTKQLGREPNETDIQFLKDAAKILPKEVEKHIK